MEVRGCLQCLKSLEGRTDKKFCCDRCRNNYNNKANRDITNYVRNVNNALRRNRRILESILTLQKGTVTTKTLVKKGFDFDVLTGYAPTKDSKVYRYCYEYGYLQLNNEDIIVVKRKETV